MLATEIFDSLQWILMIVREERDLEYANISSLTGQLIYNWRVYVSLIPPSNHPEPSLYIPRLLTLAKVLKQVMLSFLLGTCFVVFDFLHWAEVLKDRKADGQTGNDGSVNILCDWAKG